MKKLMMVATVAMVGAALPQAGHAQGISLGAKAGLNMANLSGDAVENTDLKTGLTVGAFLTISTPGPLAIQPEVLFSQKGTKQDYVFDTTPVDASWSTTYVDIPVLVRLGMPMPGSPMKPFIFAGPSAGFLLSSKVKAESDGTSVEVDNKDDLKSMDWSAVLGAGLDFNALSVDLRANLGLSSIDDSGDEADIKNRTFTLMLGYRLPLGL